MASKTQEQLVLAADVAAYLQVGVEHVLHLAAEQGATVEQDWRGRPCIADTAARRIREGHEADQREEMRLRSEHAAWLQTRAVRRTALVQKARADALGSGAATSASSARVFAAQQEALTRFDAAEPEEGYYEWKERNAGASRLKAAR